MIATVLFVPMMSDASRRDYTLFTLVFTRGNTNYISDLLVAKNDLSGSTKMNVVNVVINSLNKVKNKLWEDVPLTKGEKEFVFDVVAKAESKLMASDVMELVYTNGVFESVEDKDGYTAFVIASEER